MFVTVQLLPNRNPVMRLYHWLTEDPVGEPITGTAISGRSTRYRFNLTGIAPGRYVVDMASPIGGFNLIMTDTDYKICDEWWQIDVIAVFVIPTVGIGVLDLVSRDIEAPTDAALTVARSIVDFNGNPVTLPADCYFVLCDENEVHVVTLTPTVSGSSYNVTIPRQYTNQRTLQFALRSNTTANIPFDIGSIAFTYAATRP